MRISLDKSKITEEILTYMDKEVHPMNLYDLPIPVQNFLTSVLFFFTKYKKSSLFNSMNKNHGKFRFWKYKYR